MKYLILLLSNICFGMGSKTFCKYFPQHESCVITPPADIPENEEKAKELIKEYYNECLCRDPDNVGEKEYLKVIMKKGAKWVHDDICNSNEAHNTPKPCEEPPIPHPCEPCNPNNPPECGPLPPECNEPEPSDFNWKLVKKYGGPEIGIAKDIADWPVTRKFTLKSIKNMKLISSIDGKAYEPAVDGLSGNFNSCVKQSDGFYTCGSWDYCRASYQTTKTLENLESGGTMANSFNLQKGSEICFFYSGLARSNKRNVKERSNLVCTEWIH